MLLSLHHDHLAEKADVWRTNPSVLRISGVDPLPDLHLWLGVEFLPRSQYHAMLLSQTHSTTRLPVSGRSFPFAARPPMLASSTSSPRSTDSYRRTSPTH
ncbi:hypothetical protein RchiOBHm_Chr5g0037791 [Rosa chinensis]|uniref:Uncharacterized protein n=1 Tax=Rosa chinensis TaxID=74649 RepID=A0A2P6QBU2_ROSCH|nr:hypothetical protein RchiOBHm_Chr5g0037791 [Rosa chinensis]